MYPNDKEKIMTQHFTNKEINELLTARIKGKRHAEIAASLGRTPKSVRAKAYAMNKIAPLPTTLEELAENFDVWTQKNPKGRPKKPLKSLDEILDGWDEADEPAKKATVQAFKDPNLTDEEVVQVFKKPPTGKIRAKPKYYLRNASYGQKEDVKKLGARWDGMCWFVPDNLTGEARGKLISHYGPVHYGNHSRKGKGQWETFTFADNVSPNATTNSRGNIAPAAKTKAKTKPVKTKSQQPAVKTTDTYNTAVGYNSAATAHNYFVIRIPKVYVWVVITASLMAAAWYVGKTY
jgi:hypothetical protein